MLIGRTGLARRLSGKKPFHGPNELLERGVLKGALTVACLFQRTHARSKNRKCEVDLYHSKNEEGKCF